LKRLGLLIFVLKRVFCPAVRQNAGIMYRKGLTGGFEPGARRAERGGYSQSVWIEKQPCPYYHCVMINRKDFYLEDLKFVMTCIACPEQYDVFDHTGKKAGYVRLRHGELRCDYPECGGETIYEADPAGDGCFDTDEERDHHLQKIARCIKEKMKAG
jgi:hypothetical protein